MSIRPTSATLMLGTAFGCTLDPGGTTSTTTGTNDGTTTALDTSGTTGEPPPATGVTAVSDASGADTDTGGDPEWCHRFDPEAAGLMVHNNADVP